jgi:hypothetical protein
LASGNYVFSLAGTEPGGSPYYFAGAFTVSTSGGVATITNGEQDFSDYAYWVRQEPITGGTITATSDGNLLITLTFSDTYINGGAGTLTLDASLVSASKALLIEYDNYASASGELDLQATSLSAPSGGYAFFTGGLENNPTANYPPLAIGGVIDVDSAGGISGTGSILDINEGGTLYPVTTLTTSTVSTTPDAYGLVTFDLNIPSCPAVLCFGTTGAASIVLDGYMVDANHIRLIENWYADNIGALVAGTALAQTGTGAFSSSSISGSTYVVGSAGADTNGALQVAGVLTFNSDGSVSGNLSFNDLAAQSPQGGTALATESATATCASGTATTACYTIDASGTGIDGGTGRVTITNVTDSTTAPTFNYNLQLYLTGDGHALVISMDNFDVLAGSSWQQASGTFNAASLTGSYALGIGQVVSNEEQVGVGAFYADGVSKLTGFLDANGILTVGALAPDNSFSAAFATTSTNGVFTVTGSGGGTTDTAYLVDNTKGVVIENDTKQLTLGYFEQQQ